MSRIFRIITLTVSVMFLGLVMNDDASAQQKTLREQLIGSWKLVSSDNYAPDGTRKPTFGPNGIGSLILNADGRYTQIQVDPDRPRFKSNNRLTGTPEENTVAVQGTTASFGTWSVDEATQALTYHVEGALYPNAQGGTERRVVILNGDEMKYVNKGGPGGSYGEVIYRRIK
jgi:Lipocalin-like domain